MSPNLIIIILYSKIECYVKNQDSHQDIEVIWRSYRGHIYRSCTNVAYTCDQYTFEVSVNQPGRHDRIMVFVIILFQGRTDATVGKVGTQKNAKLVGGATINSVTNRYPLHCLIRHRMMCPDFGRICRIFDESLAQKGGGNDY